MLVIAILLLLMYYFSGKAWSERVVAELPGPDLKKK